MTTAIEIQKCNGYRRSTIAFSRSGCWHVYSIDTESRAGRAQRVANALIKSGAEMHVGIGFVTFTWQGEVKR